MVRNIGGALLAILLVAIPAALRAEQLRPVEFTKVQITDRFWAPRIKLNREKVLPHNFKFCEQTGRITNFDKAAGVMPGKFEGIFFNDSDVYKVIEGAAYSLAQERDPELEKLTDSVIARIAAAQQPDGYLYTFYTVNRQLDKRFTDERDMHETYCAGHLIEAAVAYYEATHKRKLLDVAERLADYLCTVFNETGRKDVPGHEEIELALVRLYNVTSRERYLKLAEFFIDQRGDARGHKLYGEYAQDQKPVAEQDEIAGHAVRAMYLYSGVADIARQEQRKNLVDAMGRIWNDVVGRKMYVTGGIGPSAANEGFTVPYDLPNDSAYAETCAAIGMALWNQRLALMTGDARYVDVLERAMYNGLISGVSLDGERFFYVNPLASRGSHHRQAWFDCSCCPTNIVRFLPSVGGYMYASGGKTLYVNLYMASRLQTDVGGKPLTIEQTTDYPWDGHVTLAVDPGQARELTLKLRIPGWARNEAAPGGLYTYADAAHEAPTLRVNGKRVALGELDKGYVTLRRTWKKGDKIELSLPMPARRLRADSRVKADTGRVALQRGPIVYCVEGIDCQDRARSLALPAGAPLTAKRRADLLGGVTVLEGTGQTRTVDGTTSSTAFTAVPYYAWDNRRPGAMVVWLPEDASLAQPLPRATPAGQAAVEVSYCWSQDTTTALNDQLEPSRSNDQSVPRMTWWDHLGTSEYAQYTFKEPRTVSAVRVYWFDDRPTGGCRVPASWRLLYTDGKQWLPVEGASTYGVEQDTYNRVTFKPVRTDKLRLQVQLQPKQSAGILEWRVE